MKFLRNILDKIEPHFKKGGKLESLYPLYEAGDTFLYTPNDKAKHAPFVRDNIDLKRTMILVVIALLPCLLFGIFNVGHQYYQSAGADRLAWTKEVYRLYLDFPQPLKMYGMG